MVARTTLDPRKMERAVREAFLAVDKTQPVFNVKPMEFYLQASLAERTFTLALLGLFGLLALALASVGIYGVISYSVSLRTREVGIRIALGATRRDVLVMVLGQGLTLIGLGLVAGFAASLALTRFLSSLLYDVRPWDPVTSSAWPLCWPPLRWRQVICPPGVPPESTRWWRCDMSSRDSPRCFNSGVPCPP